MPAEIFPPGKTLIGVVHLLPLPGSPGWQGDLDRIVARAKKEARDLEEGGVYGMIVENFGDVPYLKGRVEPHTIAAVTLAVEAVKATVSVPVGINVLRNDVRSALAIAAVTGAQFVRANIHYGVMVADEGVIEGDAHETLRYRRMLGVDIKIMADLHVKHAAPLGPADIAVSARDTVDRGLADVIIVSGPATGMETSIIDVSRVKEAIPETPVFVGSGVNENNVDSLMRVADGAIVGTSFKKDGLVQNPVDPERVKGLAHHFRGIISQHQ